MAVRNVVLLYFIIKIIKANIINNKIILITIEIINVLNIILFINITSYLMYVGDDNYTSNNILLSYTLYDKTRKMSMEFVKKCKKNKMKTCNKTILFEYIH